MTAASALHRAPLQFRDGAAVCRCGILPRTGGVPTHMKFMTVDVPARTVFTMLFAFAAILRPSSSFAQSSSGTIVGDIMDPSGAAVPATITATNQDTGVVRNTATSESGIYRIPSL